MPYEPRNSRMGKMSSKARGLLRLAGFLTWSLAGLPLFAGLAQAPELLQQPRYRLWLTCFFIFGATFGLTPWTEGSSRPRRFQLASLTVQAITALVMIVRVFHRGDHRVRRTHSLRHTEDQGDERS